MRRSNGCDSPLKREDAQYAVTCPVCDGGGCDVCSAQPFPGCKLMPRCPAHYQDRNIAEAVRAYADMRDHHILPQAGGMLDQSAKFVQFARVFGAEISRIQEENKT